MYANSCRTFKQFSHARMFGTMDATVKHILQVYGEQQEFLWVYDEQVIRWQREALISGQRQQLESMAQQLIELNALLSDILAIAEAVPGKTSGPS